MSASSGSVPVYALCPSNPPKHLSFGQGKYGDLHKATPLKSPAELNSFFTQRRPKEHLCSFQPIHTAFPNSAGLDKVAEELAAMRAEMDAMKKSYGDKAQEIEKLRNDNAVMLHRNDQMLTRADAIFKDNAALKEQIGALKQEVAKGRQRDFEDAFTRSSNTLCAMLQQVNFVEFARRVLAQQPQDPAALTVAQRVLAYRHANGRDPPPNTLLHWLRNTPNAPPAAWLFEHLLQSREGAPFVVPMQELAKHGNQLMNAGDAMDILMFMCVGRNGIAHSTANADQIAAWANEFRTELHEMGHSPMELWALAEMRRALPEPEE